MNKSEFLLELSSDKKDPLNNLSAQPYFPLARYNYTLLSVLNNRNRWGTKIVCSILDSNFKHYVSTTYAKRIDYLRLIETTTFLKSRHKLSPKLVQLYPNDNTVVCEYVGGFLSDCLSENHKESGLILTAVFEYFKRINSINKCQREFIVPSIIESSLDLSAEFDYEFNFLPEFKAILPELVNSNLKFTYGCGIEDPHIWNFRIVKKSAEVQALTTDFDYFSNEVNYFWELGYFYATFRWLKKSWPSFINMVEKKLLSLIEGEDLKSEFMFWLGVLSSYCGYKDSLKNLINNGGIEMLREQSMLINGLDKKLSYLGNKLIFDAWYAVRR